MTALFRFALACVIAFLALTVALILVLVHAGTVALVIVAVAYIFCSQLAKEHRKL
jgi:heme A synthase